MADEKEKLENGLYKIVAGQSVENFLNDINENFKKVQLQIKGSPNEITFSTSPPASDEIGKNGDIWIVYETNEE